ncbi:YjgB family protein [Paenibacillus agri]|uniref:YjgB family protein n=1 Tax=Paenibacillus agri TaxID=2744309 RepID=A0A850EVH5_9BACL|nr:YjgB family protein [Paenibacillus agri]NUU63669.1 YjgB family protein [Paenibacillus agri]
MRLKQPILKITLAAALTTVVGVGAVIANPGLLPVSQAATASASVTDSGQALKTLNSFYKPALKGQFPGSVSSLTVGKSTRQEVSKLLGEPEQKGNNADAFDVYHAEMGHPGYAIAYKLDKIREIRYLGTNVERQTNIGGITMSMLKKNWFAPSSTTTIKNGKLKQTKLTYVRGDYKLEFIFNSSTDLDHINLLHS